MSERFIDTIIKRAHEETEGITFLDSAGETTLTYGALCRTAQEWAGSLMNRGVRQGSHVVLQIVDNKALVPAFWAALWIGAIPVPMPPARSPEDNAKLVRVIGLLDNPVVLSDHVDAFTPKVQQITIDTASLSQDSSGEAFLPEPADVSAEDTRIIQFSSGSTGSPKGIIVTESVIVRGLEAIVPRRPAKVKNSMLTWLPLTHNLSLLGFHVYAILQNYSQVLMPTASFVANPLSWLRAINDYRPTVTACVNFAFRHLLRYITTHQSELEGIDLSSVHKILCGSEPIDPELAAKVQSELHKYGLRTNAINAGYGLSEACLLVSVSDIYEPLHVIYLNRSELLPGNKLAEVGPTDGSPFVSVGHEAPGITVSIRDDEGQDLGNEVIGEIYISGPSVTSKVLTDNGVQDQPFTDDGALATGDIGVLHKDELYVVGRRKDIIFIGGKNYYSNDLESLFEKNTGIQCAVLGAMDPKTKTEAVYVFGVRKEGLAEKAGTARLKQTAMQQLAIPIHHVAWVDELPTTPNGKICRHRLEATI